MLCICMCVVGAVGWGGVGWGGVGQSIPCVSAGRLDLYSSSFCETGLPLNKLLFNFTAISVCL